MLRASTSAIALDAVSKTYRSKGGPVPALRQVSFQIAPGEAVAVVGPSGSGKSTLLHLLSGLDEADEGSILAFGQDLSAMDDDARAAFRNRSVGFVFQDFHLLPEFDACMNVALPLLLRRPALSRRSVFAKARAALASVGLEDRLRHRPGELSGGEQQRVAIARALVTEPRLFVADEPTGNLDAKTGREVIRALRKLQRERNATLVLATHDEAVAAACDRVLKMADGRLRR